jgi:16S rRNA (adenine1518-N6/adenine1519-N6)-dimethyltransferase
MAAKRSLGQHFLVARGAIHRIVHALGLRPGEPLLEIGPGRGALTASLVDTVGRIAAVELDHELASALRHRFDPRRLVLIERDILKVDLGEVLRALDAPPGARLVIAGNLPYNISKPVAQKLIAERARIERGVLMFQREVAGRLTAGACGRGYGPLGILARRAFRVERLFDLPPRAFSPPPQVTSTVTRWCVRPGPLTREEERRLRCVLAACFARRRKTLRNNLLVALGDATRADALLAAAALDGSRRAESLPAAAFGRLAALWEDPPLL